MRAAFAAGLALSLLVWGVMLDRAPTVTQPQLFLAFHVAGLAATGLAASLFWPRLPKGGSRLGLLLVGYLVWRVSYFPVMVGAGHLAAIVEWPVDRVGISAWCIYPSLLLTMALMNFTATAMACAAVFGTPQPRAEGETSRVLQSTVRWGHRLLQRRLLAPVAAAALTFASLISFSANADLTPLPDWPWSATSDLPPPTLPTANPYWPMVTEPGYHWRQRPLLFAAGTMYPTVPEGPWGRIVKGVLQAEFLRRPRGTSADRTEEHYLAYLVAHPFIGGRAE